MSEPPMPLYDEHTELRAWWIGDHIFGLDLDWAAFVYDGHAFTAGMNSTWLGPIRRGVVMDTSGRVMLWTPNVSLVAEVAPYRPPRAPRPPRPERPIRPNSPPRPYKPARPSEGWSKQPLEGWLGGGIAPQAQDDAIAGVSPNEISFDD